MARQTYYVTREQKNPLYRTRMLQAGPIELDASAARLFRKLGVDLSDEAPRKAAQIKTEIAASAPAKPAAKRAPRKRKAAAKK